MQRVSSGIAARVLGTDRKAVMYEALCADKRSGHGLSLEELRTRGGGGVSYHGTLHSALTISLGSAGGAPRAK